MSVTADWPNKILHVWKADLELVQSVPTVIYNMDLNWFRLQLKALEDDAVGMTWPDTHKHNTEVLLGGLTYARVIEMINGYSVTFEDDQYAVNLIGANSNVGDVVNVNQVSVRSANSAGMTSSPTIEHLSFDQMITIDPINGMEGVTFPAGNKQYPAKYNQDAYDISVYRRIKHLHFVGENSITAPLELDGYTLSGDGPVLASLDIDTLAEVQGCFIQGLKLSGVLDGGTAIRDALIDGIHYFNGSIRDCGVSAVPIVLGGTATAILNDCKSMVPGEDNRPTVDFDNQPTSLAVRGWSGGLELINKTTTAGEVSIDMDSGILYIRASCTAGKIVVRGLGRLVDESPDTCEVDYTGLLDPTYIQYMTYEGSIWLDETTDNTGTTYPVGTEEYPVNNWADAVTLTNLLKFHIINFTGVSTVLTGTDISGKVINGINAIHSSLVVEENSSTRDTTFLNLSFLDGYLDGNNLFRDCYVDGMHGFTGIAHQCTFTDTPVYISGLVADQVNILDCYGSSSTDQLINFNFINDAIGIPLTMRNWSGCAELINHTTEATCCINFTGEFFIRASCSVGQYDMSGNGKLWDESTGTSTVLTYKLSNPDQVTQKVWSENLHKYITPDTAGKLVHDINFLDSYVYINTELGEVGCGTSDKPFNDVSTAVDFAEARGWKQLRFLSDATLERKLKNFVIEGIGGMPTLDINGQDVDKSEFLKVKLTGTQVGSVTAREVVLLNLQGVNGIYKESGIIGSITLADDAIVTIVSASNLPVSASLSFNEINMGNGSGGAVLNLRKYSGGVEITNVNNSDRIATCEFSGGQIAINGSNTAGVIGVVGLPDTAIIGTGAGVSINKLGVFPGADTNADAVWSYER